MKLSAADRMEIIDAHKRYLSIVQSGRTYIPSELNKAHIAFLEVMKACAQNKED
jgi:hypothetical protein